MKKVNRILAVLMSIVLCSGMFVTKEMPVKAETGDATIYIRSVADLEELARNCVMDTWSANKTVILQEDLSLNGSSFETIPFFSGTFEGNNHVISGYKASGSYSPFGFFSIIQEGAVVKNLEVDGSVNATGTGENVGGLCGINNGTVAGCVFSGSVNGNTAVGGMVGYNNVNGRVNNSRSQGAVYGQKMTGGIVGNNAGVLNNCSSASYVNTEATDSSFTLDDINQNLTDIFDTKKVDVYDVAHAATDTGGIAGYSDGMILGCTNNGSVGYQHVGYNVGGVVGRNRGFLSGCINNAEVCGRKEVGGVAGEAEPYVVTTYTDAGLESIRVELQKLSDMIDGAAVDAENTNTTVNSRLTAINQDITDASNAANDLTVALTNYVDSVATEVNRASDIVDHALYLMNGIAQQIPSIAKDMEEALHELHEAMIDLQAAAEDNEEAMKELKEASDDLEEANRLLYSASKEASEGLRKVREADSNGNISASDWRKGRKNFLKALEIIINGDEQSKDEDGNSRGVADFLYFASQHMNVAMDYLSQASEHITDTTEHLNTMSAALDRMAPKVTKVTQDIAVLTDYLDKVDPIKFNQLSPTTKVPTDNLHNSLQSCANNLQSLNTELSSNTTILVNDLREINAQFMIVMNLVIDEVEDVKSGSGLERVTDTSDEDINEVTYGKLLRCKNNGTVYGDIDVGGVAGSLGIFNETDPEGDGVYTMTTSLQKSYELKAILQACSNSGIVTAKKNYAGSICGLAKLGVITDCEAYGVVSSESGNYVGGIAGGSDTVVRNSFSKCSLSGNKYVGGIIGSGDIEDSASSTSSGSYVSNCVSLVEITDYEQFAGAVSGANAGTFVNNRFVSDELAAIDRVSYEGKAAPENYDQMMRSGDLPMQFRWFTLEFIADDEVVSSNEFQYGSSYDTSLIPAIPAKEGMYGVWDVTDYSDLRFDTTVTAQYFPYVTSLAADVKREDGRNAFLAEGNFVDGDVLTAQAVVLPFQNRPGDVIGAMENIDGEVLEQWQVNIPENASEENRVRYLPSEEADTDSLEVYLLGENGWEKTECETIGSYLCFSAPEGTSTVTVIEKSDIWWLWILAAIALIVLVIYLARRHMATRAINKARTQIQRHVAKIEAHPERKRRIHNTLVGLGILLAVIGLTVFAVLILVPGAKSDFELYRMLRTYEVQDNLDMELEIETTIGDRSESMTLPIYATNTGNRRLYVLNMRGTSLYYTEGNLLLENGKVFKVGNSLPDGLGLIHGATELFRNLECTITGDDENMKYHVVAGAEEAQTILEQLAPDVSEKMVMPDGMTVELNTEYGKPVNITFYGSGIYTGEKKAPMTLKATINLAVDQKEHGSLPLSVTSALNGNLEYAEDLSDEMREFMPAIIDLLSLDPMESDLHLSANCGPVSLATDVKMTYATEDGRDIIRLEDGDFTLFYSEGTICTESGTNTTPTLSAVDKLMPAIVNAALGGELSERTAGKKHIYTLQLSASQMEDIAASIAPEIRNMTLGYESGTLEVTLENGKIVSLSAKCGAQATIVMTDVEANFTVAATFADEQPAQMEIPAAVRNALFGKSNI